MNRPVTKKDGQDIVDSFFGAPADLFRDAVDVFDRADFVAGNEDRTPIGNAVREITRFNCRRWARSDKSKSSTKVNAENANICNPYLDSINEKPSDGRVFQPFEGGQCLCTIYEVQIVVEYTRLSTGQPFTFNQSRRCRGPLVAFTAEPFSDTDPNLTFVYTANAVSSSSSVNPSCGPSGAFVTRRERTSAPESADGRYPVTAVNITVLSGPDDCGDPPKNIEPPSTPPGLPPLPPFIPIDIPGFGPTPITIEPGPDGEPIVCFPDFDICEDFQPDPEEEPPGDGAPVPGDGQPGAEDAVGSPAFAGAPGDGGG